jgi:hypothetical protein
VQSSRRPLPIEDRRPMPITPNQPQPSVSSVLSVRNPSQPPGPSSISTGVTCPSLRTPMSARQSIPRGRLQNGLPWESACRRGRRRDMDDVHRSRPSTPEVDHSRPTSSLRVLRALREKPEPIRPSLHRSRQESLARAFEPPRVPVSRPGGEAAGDCRAGCLRSRLAVVDE